MKIHGLRPHIVSNVLLCRKARPAPHVRSLRSASARALEALNAQRERPVLRGELRVQRPKLPHPRALRGGRGRGADLCHRDRVPRRGTAKRRHVFSINLEKRPFRPRASLGIIECLKHVSKFTTSSTLRSLNYDRRKPSETQRKPRGSLVFHYLFEWLR